MDPQLRMMTFPPGAPVPPGTSSQESWLAKPSPLQLLYLALAIAGAVLPWLANLDYIRASGGSFDIAGFIAQANANPAASSLSRDLGIGATAVVAWMIVEARRLKMRGLPWVLLCCVSVAFACAAPLFLYLRERRLAELAQPTSEPTNQAAAPTVRDGPDPSVPHQP